MRQIKPIRNFIDAVIYGETSVADICHFIDLWHESDGSLDLPEFLGMTEDEFAEFGGAEPEGRDATLENIVNRYRSKSLDKD